jgi:hypothetical protein
VVELSANAKKVEYNTKKLSENKTDNSHSMGFAIALAAMSIATLLYLQPQYLGSTGISNFIAISFLVFGIIGLGLELNNVTIEAMQTEENRGFDKLGIGAGFIIFWLYLYLNFQSLVLDWAIFVLLITGAVFFYNGLIDFINKIIMNSANKREDSKGFALKTYRALWGLFGVIEVIVTLVSWFVS